MLEIKHYVASSISAFAAGHGKKSYGVGFRWGSTRLPTLADKE